LAVSFCLLTLSSCSSQRNHIEQGKQLLEHTRYDLALSEFNHAIQPDQNQYCAYWCWSLSGNGSGKWRSTRSKEQPHSSPTTRRCVGCRLCPLSNSP